MDHLTLQRTLKRQKEGVQSFQKDRKLAMCETHPVFRHCASLKEFICVFLPGNRMLSHKPAQNRVLTRIRQLAKDPELFPAPSWTLSELFILAFEPLHG